MTVLYVKSDIFDFSILHSTTKWNVPSVCSLLEELKNACGNRTVTRSKWIDVSTSKLSLVEAQCYWSVFTSTANTTGVQGGDWMDLSILGILLLCQCYPNSRARAESFHRTEVFAQSLATSAVASPAVNASLARPPTSWNPLINLPKLIRDNGHITQFICDNVEILVGIITLNLGTDDDIPVSGEEVSKLGVLLACETNRSITDVILGTMSGMKSSDLAAVLKISIQWNDKLFPPLEVSSRPERLAFSWSGRQSLYITNQSRTTIMHSWTPESKPANVYVLNCSETTIYIPGPVQNVSIMGCVECEVVILTSIGSVVASYSDRVIVRVVASALRLESCTDCHAFVYTTKGIILAGDTRGIQLAPFNVVYSSHTDDLARAGLHPDSSHATLWCQPLCATLSESPYSLLAPNRLRLTHYPELNPRTEPKLAVCLPQIYADALMDKNASIMSLKSELASVTDPANIPKLNAIISGHFREWITSSNRTRTMSDFLKLNSNQ